MSTCEKCWNDAFTRSRLSGTHQADEYRKLLPQYHDAHVAPVDYGLTTEVPSRFFRKPTRDEMIDAFRYHCDPNVSDDAIWDGLAAVMALQRD